MAGRISPREGQPSAANPAVNRARQFPSVSGRRSPVPGLCLAHHPRGETETQTALWEKNAASSSAFIPWDPGGTIKLCHLPTSSPAPVAAQPGGTRRAARRGSGVPPHGCHGSPGLSGNARFLLHCPTPLHLSSPSRGRSNEGVCPYTDLAVNV